MNWMEEAVKKWDGKRKWRKSLRVRPSQTCGQHFPKTGKRKILLLPKSNSTLIKLHRQIAQPYFIPVGVSGNLYTRKQKWRGKKVLQE